MLTVAQKMLALQRPRATAATSFTPTSIAGLAAWYDASVASSITSAGGLVSQWNDLSTSGFHLTAATTARPTTAAHTQNGLNVLDFDGTANILKNLAVSVTAGNAGTWFVVVNQSSSSPTNFGRLVSLMSDDEDFNKADAIAAICRDGTNAAIAAFYNGAERGITAATDDAAHQATTQRNGDSFAAWVDGGAGATATGLGTANFGFTALSVGAYWKVFGVTASGFSNCRIGEVLWYNAALSTGNRQLVEAYLKSKWSTP